MNIKEKLDRFRQWQLDPRHYENKSHGSVCCQNCGMEYADNFCPRCGQRAGMGRVTWQTLSQGFMYIWGLDSRSLPYTLLQLLGRPGYLIRDYISGRRQVSFPPVKMLFLVALVYLLIEHLIPAPVEEIVDEERDFLMLESFQLWFKNNPGWGMIINCSLLLLPTWLLFRFAPQYPKHTLPEGFFIQVFMATLMLIIALVADITTEYIYVLAIIYYVITYRQLFGYGWWGTIWRMLLVLFVGFVIMIVIAVVYELVVTRASLNPKHTMAQELLAITYLVTPVVVIFIAAYYIGKRGSKQRNRTE